MSDSAIARPTRRRIAVALFLGWLSMLGVDLLLHGGLLARHYAEPHPFLLPPWQAFARIPLGYLSFFLLAVLLIWLMLRLELSGWRAGAVFGLQVGTLVWGSFALGLISITSADPWLLLGWLLGQTAEASIAGGFMGAALVRKRVGGLVGWVFGLILGCVAATVLLQSLGLAPALSANPPPSAPGESQEAP